MDSHSFKFRGERYTAQHGTFWLTGRTPEKGEVLRAAYAEILRLAEREKVLIEERDNFRRSAEWDSEQRDFANKKLDEIETERNTLRSLNKTLAKENDRAISRWAVAVEERDAAKLTAEEGQEMVEELSMALAILAGETLLCNTSGEDCNCTKYGALGLKAAEAVDHALAAYRALQEGNRQAVERIKELEGAVEMESGTGILRFALLTNLLTEINRHHTEGEGALDILRRLIREREQAQADHRRAIEKCQETEGARLTLLADLRRLKGRMHDASTLLRTE